jgi:hypothetical protein
MNFNFVLFVYLFLKGIKQVKGKPYSGYNQLTSKLKNIVLKKVSLIFLQETAYYYHSSKSTSRIKKKEKT